MRVVDISDPEAPVEVGASSLIGYPTDIYVAGNYAYVSASDLGLHVVDVSAPTAPIRVAWIHEPTPALGIHVVDNYAYVAAGDSGLRVLDVSNPAAPREVGAYDTYAWDVYVASPFVYVSPEGLLVLWAAPSVSTSIPATGGSLISSFDQTSYVLALGTFTDTVTLSHTPRYPDNAPSTEELVGVDHFFDVSAADSGTGQPAQPNRRYAVVVRYSDAEKGPAIEDTLGLYYWDDARWVREPTSIVHPDTNTVAAAPDHLSLWTVLGETRRIFMPAVLR